jgi:hypothetical protein
VRKTKRFERTSQEVKACRLFVAHCVDILLWFV